MKQPSVMVGVMTLCAAILRDTIKPIVLNVVIFSVSMLSFVLLCAVMLVDLVSCSLKFCNFILGYILKFNYKVGHQNKHLLTAIVQCSQ
jgi:hypothetical protein